MDKREPDDPSPYLLAIWTPGQQNTLEIILITGHMSAIVSKNYLFTNINAQQADWKIKVKHMQDYYYFYDRLKSNNLTINHSYLYF